MTQTGFKKLLVLTLILPLANCQTRTTETAPAEPLVCTQWRALGYASKHDSPETVDSVRRSNARRKAYCG